MLPLPVSTIITAWTVRVWSAIIAFSEGEVGGAYANDARSGGGGQITDLIGWRQSQSRATY